MEDLSLHILDIAENSVRAGARNIDILVERDLSRNLLSIKVEDNGRGMDAETLSRVLDPFFTTKCKKTGLGLPLFAQAAEQAGGHLTIKSEQGVGTTVQVTFQWSNVDRPSMGDMAETLLTLIAGHSDIDLSYTEREDAWLFRFDTREIRNELEDVPLNAPEVIRALRSGLHDQMKIGRGNPTDREVHNEQ